MDPADAHQGVVLSVTDFVASVNQTLEYAYPHVAVVGELANFRVSKNRWVYFDLKDEQASVRFFGTVYSLPGPLEDGMMLQVSGSPRLHPLYGFSVTFQTIQPVGEGSLKRAATLLEAKLKAEGLFSIERKRQLPYPPRKIGLIASGESAAYHDFIKVLNQRWGGIEILHVDVQVQGEQAPAQIIAALEYFNGHEDTDVIILTRGGGSPEDLAAFSTEQVTRAVASSRTPTLVAIGHEVDVSLAELAADSQASTPSNAAELLVPDKRDVLQRLQAAKQHIAYALSARISNEISNLSERTKKLDTVWDSLVRQRLQSLNMKDRLLQAYSPQAALKRGYAIVRKSGVVIRSGEAVADNDTLTVELSDAVVDTIVKKVRIQ
jgi:exodeoxyribonuclease VII large subunit